MSTAQPGPIRSFFGFIWSAVSFTNHLVFNIIMLFVLLIILGVQRKAGGKTIKPEAA